MHLLPLLIPVAPDGAVAPSGVANDTLLAWIICILAAYLAGSIPFGVMLGRLRGINIREHGSRNVGATNVARVLGKRLGGLCFALDVLKGAVPVLVAGIVNDVVDRAVTQLTHAEMWLWLAVAAAAVAGHMFSMFLKFAGGKGVATGFGAMLAMWPPLTVPAVMAFVVWFTALRMWRYVGLASVLAALSLPILVIIWNMPASGNLHETLHVWPMIVSTGVLAAVVVWKHRGNLARIRRGEEPKITGMARRGGVQ
ncbi:MAG: glycerol-3-phosphate 1-O-acyltransferase PlsY [Phycisphaerales bacterium]